MANTDIVVVGASAGGVEALRAFVSELPEKLNAAVFVVVHFPENAVSVLPRILQRAGKLPAGNPLDEEPIQPGRIYVAPPGCHLLVKLGKVRLVRGPKENGHRPAIDPLFRSASRVYGKRVAAILLSGMLDDGVNGLGYVKRHGGVALVQDPTDALFGDMPRNAIEGTDVDHVASVKQLAHLVSELANGNVPDYSVANPGNGEVDPVEMGIEELRALERNGRPSVYTCPECNGTLFEFNENGVRHYRCRVGHAYSDEALESHQTEELEAALWEALRTMEENLGLSRKLLEKAEHGNRRASVAYYTDKVATSERRVNLLRHVLTQVIEHSSNGDGP